MLSAVVDALINQAGYVLGAAIVALPSLAAWWNSKKAKQELKTNGGSSTRDAVDRIESKIDSMDTRLTAVEEALTKPEGDPS